MYTEQDACQYQVHNNSQLIQEKRSLIIDIFEGLETDSVLPVKLGTFVIAMDRVDHECPNGPSWGALTEVMVDCPSVEFGEVEIEMCIVNRQKEYAARKMREAEERLRVQIENIERFNAELSVPNSTKLTANIYADGRLSLLHAAIHLQRRDYVQKLLELNADPSASSSVGSAILFAKNLRDRVSEKKNNAAQKNRGADDIQKLEEKYENYNMMVRVMEEIVERSGVALPTSKKMQIDSSTSAGPSDSSERRNKDTSAEFSNDLYGDLPLGNFADTRAMDVSSDSKEAAGGISGDPSLESVRAVDSSDSDSVPDDEKLDGGKVKTLTIADENLAGPQDSNEAREYDAKLLREIMRAASKSAGGNRDGTQVGKAFIGSKFSEMYGRIIKNRKKVKETARDFMKRVVSSGLAEEIRADGVVLYRLCDTAREEKRKSSLNGAKKAPTKDPVSSLPKLENDDWLVARWKKKRCWGFNSPIGCKFGTRCLFAHVQAPLGEQLDDDATFGTLDWMKLDHSSLIHLQDGNWHTAGYFDQEENIFYYAEKGPLSKVSDQGVCWYPTREAAEDAIRRVLAVAKYKIPSKKPAMPNLDKADWVDLRGKHRRCLKGDEPGKCWHNEKGSCHFFHVQRPLGKLLDKSIPENAILNPLYFVYKRVPGSKLVTAAYVDEDKKRIYYAEGGRFAGLSSQGVFWYETEDHAKDALERVVRVAESMR